MFLRKEHVALLLSFLLLPLVLNLVNQIHISQITSNLRLYAEEDMQLVHAPISVNMLNIYLGQTMYNVPLLVLPYYYGSLAAVALVGAQKELLYNQRSEFYVKSPYVVGQPLFTKGAVRKESVWRTQGAMYVRRPDLRGRITKLSQEFLPKTEGYGPESYLRKMCGITDAFEVFLLSSYLNQIWVNKELVDQLNEDTQRHNIRNFTKYAVSMDQDRVYVAAYGITFSAEVFVFTAALRVIDGSVDWINRGVINLDTFMLDTELFIDSVHISLEENFANGGIGDLDLLRDYMKTNPHRQHGEATFIQFTNDAVVLQTTNLIFMLQKESGIEMATFLIKEKALITTDSKSQLLLYSIADDMLLVQRLDGKSTSEVLNVLVMYVALLPQYSQTTQYFAVYEARFACYKAEYFTFVAVATPTRLFVFQNEKLIWAKSLKGILTVSIHRIYANLFALIATTAENCFIFSTTTGQYLTLFALESKQPADVENEELGRIHAGVTVARIHPFLDEKSILVQTGPKVSVLSVRSGVKFNLWLELGVGLLAAAILYGASGTINKFRQPKKE